jgi:multisubunit Na+/H+ antiporter MnhB subunit
VRAANHIVVRVMAKVVLPLCLLVSSYLALERAQGLQGGVFAAIAVALHALVFGPATTSRALPPAALRIAAVVGISALIASAAMEWRLGQTAPSLLDAAGQFLTAGACGALAVLAIAGRAHAMREEDW